MKRLLLLIMLLALPLSLSAQSIPATTPATAPAEPAKSSTPSNPPPALVSADKLAITKHQITLNNQPFPYTTTAGYLPLKSENDKLRANIFFIAYTKDSPPSPDATNNSATAPSSIENPSTSVQFPVSSVQLEDHGNSSLAASPRRPVTASFAPPSRPVTFIFNGGPGAASVWLHLGTAGPYRIALNKDGSAPPPPFKLVENAFTWLTDTDLVFIDPVGTGYSRAATPEQAKEFYNTQEDIASMGEFIRLWTTRYQRWDAPKFLAGESYGTTRAAALAQHLQDHVGMALNGVVLISSVLNFQTLAPSEANDLPYALFLPTYTATAFYHQKLPTELQRDLPQTLAQVREFALTTYLTALAKGSALPAAQRGAVLEQLSRYTGLSVDYLDKSNLRLDPARFQHQLLLDKRLVVGRMDTRVTGPMADAVNDAAPYDPSLAGATPVYAATFNSYIRQNLRYENELPYEVLKGIPWNFHAGKGGGGGGNGYLYVGDNLRSAMQKNPHLQVLVASGYYDLATPFLSADYTVDHLTLTPALRSNITQTYYHGGHMFYHHTAALEKFHQDLSAFIKAATPR